MRWDDLQVLLALDGSASLSEAARKLGVNQTTVSRRITALEETLEVRLIERDPDGVRLSPNGERAVAAAREMSTISDALEREILGKDAALRGRLRVTTVDMVALYHAELFREFAERHPEVKLELSTTYHQRSLTRREADLAIRFSNRPDEHLFGRKLVRVEYAVHSAAALVDKHGRRARLDRYPWLAWDEASGARVTEAWMKQHVPDARVACTYDSATAMHAAIRDGVGVAFIPCAYGDGLVRLRRIEPAFGYDLWALTHEDLRRTARVRAFMDHAALHFAKQRRRFRGR